MRNDRYRNHPTSWLRVLLAATDNAFGELFMGGARVEIEAELTKREIEEDAEVEAATVGAHAIHTIRGVQ